MAKKQATVTLSEICDGLKMDPKNGRAKMRRVLDTVGPWLIDDAKWEFPAGKRSAVEALLKRNGRKA